MIEFVAKEIQRLSQDEGLNDGEIADLLKVSRATVNRARQAYEIPRANLDNRKDKEYVCSRCGATVTIARKERKKKYCEACKPIVDQENLARKTARYQVKKSQKAGA